MVLWFCGFSISAQNLISNPSFEDTVGVGFNLYYPLNWQSATGEANDYYTAYDTINLNWSAPKNLAGIQKGFSGISYIGIMVYKLYENLIDPVREYARTQLKQILQKDSIYCLRLYTSMADSFQFASKNQLGIYFSDTAIGANNRFSLPYTPQIIISPDSFNTDKENWTEYNFQYTASGGERYMTVGNFNDTNSIDTLYVGGGDQFFYEASYYYLDDFYLGSCDSLPEDSSIGLRENGLLQQAIIYPNPFKEVFHLKYQGSKNHYFDYTMQWVRNK